MSDENNTERQELEGRIIIKIPVTKGDAEDVLNQFGGVFPKISEIDEIHFVIKEES